MIAHLALAVLIATTAGSSTPPTPTAQELADSVYTTDLEYAVSPLYSSNYEDGKTIISLSSDILFDTDKSDLPDSSGTQIGTQLAEVPQGAALVIEGHTDSIKGAVPNQKLSKDRAEAVAKLVRKQRPDLKLTVKGLADTDPAVTEDPTDPSTRAKNRRVELIYGD